MRLALEPLILCTQEYVGLLPVILWEHSDQGNGDRALLQVVSRRWVWGKAPARTLHAFFMEAG